MPSRSPSPNLRAHFSRQGLDAALEHDLRALVRIAIYEDLDRWADLTTLALVPDHARGQAKIIARCHGVAAGLDLIPWMIDEMDADIVPVLHRPDQSLFDAGDVLVDLTGNTRDLLTCERTILNFLGRLCGIATLTRAFVDKIAGTHARLYDTRKTTPGWRRLEKYATSCGGGYNHRHGLYDAVLIKDNHLACRAAATGEVLNPRQAVAEANAFLARKPFEEIEDRCIEVEVDSLPLLRLALTPTTHAHDRDPDIILLDNMTPDRLREGVAIRNAMAPSVILEASGGVRLETVRAIAESGVDRISVGALTHSAINLDLGLDWALD